MDNARRATGLFAAFDHFGSGHGILARTSSGVNCSTQLNKVAAKIRRLFQVIAGVIRNLCWVTALRVDVVELLQITLGKTFAVSDTVGEK